MCFLCAGLVCVNSSLYAVGGYNGQSQLSSVERYNIARNLWEPRASMHQCRSAHGVTVHQGCIYVFGKSVSHDDAEIHSSMAAVASRGAIKTFTAPPRVDLLVPILAVSLFKDICTCNSRNVELFCITDG